MLNLDETQWVKQYGGVACSILADSLESAYKMNDPIGEEEIEELHRCAVDIILRELRYEAANDDEWQRFLDQLEQKNPDFYLFTLSYVQGYLEASAEAVLDLFLFDYEPEQIAKEKWPVYKQQMMHDIARFSQ